MKNKSIVGEPINFRGLIYAPTNENGVIFLFGKVANDLNFCIEEIKPGFPDCRCRRLTEKGWELKKVEFEYASYNFVEHGHDVNGCDIIICWEHNWRHCPLEVIELKSVISHLDDYMVKQPPEGQIEKMSINLIQNVKGDLKVGEWYTAIMRRMSKLNNLIWAKVGRKYVGLYSPERAFASLKINKSTIRIQCFSRGLDMPQTKPSSSKPRWVTFTVKADQDVEKAIEILSESYYRIKGAIQIGEATSYFSGSVSFKRNSQRPS